MDPKLIRQIRKALLEKYGVRLPPDLTPQSFGRDLLCALSGHPGWDVHPDLIAEGEQDYGEEEAGDMGEYEGDDLDDDEDDEDIGSGRMSHQRRQSVRDEVLANVGPTLANGVQARPARLSQSGSLGSDRVLDEVLANCGLN